MNKKRFVATLLAVTVLATGGSMSAHAASTQEQIEAVQQEKAQSEASLVETQEQIESLESQKGDLESYLSQLSQQYEELSANLEELAAEAEQKQEELRMVRKELKNAKEKEKQQYESMKIRISYMYENSKENLLMSLLSAKSFTDFLTRAENFVQISKYDRDMLEKYELAKEKVRDQKQAILVEKESIIQLQEESDRKRQEVESLAADAQSEIDLYSEEIGRSEGEAASLLETVNSQSEQLDLLVAKAEEEAEAARKAAEEELAKQQAEAAEAAEAAQAAQAESERAEAESQAQEQQVSQALESQETGDTGDAILQSVDEDGISEQAVAEEGISVEDDSLAENEEDEEETVDASAEEENVPEQAADIQENTVIEEGTVNSGETAEPTVTDDSGSAVTDDSGSAVTDDSESAVTDDSGSAVTDDSGYTVTDDSESEEEYGQESTGSAGTYLGEFTLTAYCACSICCGSWSGGGTASGTTPEAGRTVAMGGVPFGTKLLINGNVYTVEDRGTGYGHVDIFMNSHSEALQFGSQSAAVYQLN